MDWKRGEVVSRTVTFEMIYLSRGAECSVASVPLLLWVLVSKTYWAAPTAADPEKRSAADNDRERPAQIHHISTQTNFETQKFHVRDTTNFLQDYFKTRKCLSGPPTRRPLFFCTPDRMRVRFASYLRQGARGASRRRKSTPGEPPERPGAPSEPPSGTPGRPGEPTRPDIANRLRGSTIFTAPPGAPGTP